MSAPAGQALLNESWVSVNSLSVSHSYVSSAGRTCTLADGIKTSAHSQVLSAALSLARAQHAVPSRALERHCMSGARLELGAWCSYGELRNYTDLASRALERHCRSGARSGLTRVHGDTHQRQRVVMHHRVCCQDLCLVRPVARPVGVPACVRRLVVSRQGAKARPAHKTWPARRKHAAAHLQCRHGSWRMAGVVSTRPVHVHVRSRLRTGQSDQATPAGSQHSCQPTAKLRMSPLVWNFPLGEG